MTLDSGVTQPIKNKKWEKFFEHPESVVISIVKECYVNTHEHQDYRMFVRRKMVLFNKTTINRYYELPDIENDEYHNLIEGELDWNMIKDVLCKAGTQ